MKDEKLVTIMRERVRHRAKRIEEEIKGRVQELGMLVIQEDFCVEAQKCAAAETDPREGLAHARSFCSIILFLCTCAPPSIIMAGRRSFNDSVQPDERKFEESSKNAHRIQRKQRLEALVQKRTTNFEYLKKIHDGGNYWLNVMLLIPQDVRHFVSKLPKQRIVHFYYLGLSVHSILDSKTSGKSVVKSFSQLMEEFEYFCSGTPMQSVKNLMAKNSPSLFPQTMQIEDDEYLMRPTVFKFHNVVVFEELKTPHLSFELDYVEVIAALSDGLCKLYERFLSPDCFA